MLRPDVAARTILEQLRPLPVTLLPVSEAQSLVLAQDTVSPFDLPRWDNSAMDGYAARSDDLRRELPIVLRMVEEVPAGAFPTRPVGPGECTRVATGAPTPQGADTVVRQEDTNRIDSSSVEIRDTRDLAKNVRRRGEDILQGTTVLKRGTTIGPAQMGVLVSLAQDRVPVFRRPVVAILASGDEIADLDERDAILAGTKIASSNTYTLTALVQAAGATPLSLGIAKDNRKDLRERLQRASGADLIVTTAGVSVGERDYLRDVLADLALEEIFWRVKMRPGAPVGFGLIGEMAHTPWIGLPGNPVSTMVTFELFVRPAIRKLAGHDNPFRRTVRVCAGERIVLGPPLRHFLRIMLAETPSGLVGSLTGPQGSGILTSMANADALMVVPEDVSVVTLGQELNAIVLDDPRHVSEVPW
jgi:molybdopterin molybdotransferase